MNVFFLLSIAYRFCVDFALFLIDLSNTSTKQWKLELHSRSFVLWRYIGPDSKGLGSQSP